MSFRSGFSFPGSRARVVASLLVLTLGLAGVLAYQVIDANRSHERVAKKTVGEQATVAAWAFTLGARRTLDDKLFLKAMNVVELAGGADPEMPFSWETLIEKAEVKEWGYFEYVSFAFRINVATNELAVIGPAEDATRVWLARDLLETVAGNVGYWFRPAVVFQPGTSDPLVYVSHVDGEDEPLTIYGLEIRREALQGPLQYAFEDYPLLPGTLTGGFLNEELLTVRVRSPEGVVLYSSGPSLESAFTGSDTMGVVFGGMTADVTIRPSRAEMLVIGGFPRSRLPLVLGLLALAGALVLAAIFQLKREAELAQLRADFVSGVSHELRTPLAQIRMFSETLLLGRVRNEEERRRSLEIIVNESQRLSHQLDNVLLFSKAERGGMRVSTEKSDLGVLVTEVLEAFRPLAEAADVRLESEVSPGVVASVDSGGLRQSLLNLLDNAVKYGPPGQTIRVGLSRLPARRVLLWVEDEGSGIPPDLRGHIFEPYFRLEEHRESAAVGSGIGLAVVRAVVEQHDGTVRVEAANGKGARFVIELPSGLPRDLDRRS